MWSTNDKCGSRVIRWGLGEPSSHFAMCFFEDQPACATVLESRLDNGVDTCSLKDFQSRNKIIHMLQCPMDGDQEADIFRNVYDSINGVQYDYPAILYWIYVGFMRKFFDKPLPKVNEMNRTEMMYCVEIIGLLNEYLNDLGIDLEDYDISMLSPEQIYFILYESEMFRSLPC